MANKVYEKDQEGQRAYHPPNMDPLDNQAAGKSSDPRGDLQDAEQDSGLYNPNGDTGDSKSPGDLQAAESNAANQSGNEGGLYTPEESKPRRGSAIVNFARKNKGKTLGFSIGGGSLIATIIIALFSIIPLKIEHMVTKLQDRFLNAPKQALVDGSRVVAESYIMKHVIPAYKNCGTTIDRNCKVSIIGGESNPVTNYYRSLAKDRFENKLAAKGIEVKFDTGSRTWYYKTPRTTGKGENIGANGEKLDDLFQRTDRDYLSRELGDALAEETLYPKTWKRYIVGNYTDRIDGTKRYIFFDGVRSYVPDTIEEIKQSGKHIFAQRVLVPHTETVGLAMLCLLNTDCHPDQLSPNTCSDPNCVPDPAESDFDRDQRTKLVQLAAQYDSDPVKLKATFDDMSERGYGRYLTDQILQKVFKQASKESIKRATDAIPVIGWINLAAEIVVTANDAGPKIKKLRTAVLLGGGAIAAYQMYSTYSDEVHTGKVNATQVGSMSALFGEGVKDPDDPLVGGTASAEQAPLYNEVMGRPSSTSNSPEYLCNDGKPLKNGELACPEEQLGSSRAADAITDYTNLEQNRPILLAAKGWSSTIGKVFDVVGDAGAEVIGAVVTVVNAACGIPFNTSAYCAAKDVAKEAAPAIITAATNVFFPNPFGSNSGGGRNFQVAALGASGVGQQACGQLGCQRVSDAEAAEALNAYQSAEKREFSRQPLMARMFSTDNSYSLVSQMAIAMPFNVQNSAQTGFASLLANPFAAIGHSFAGIFSPARASATTAATADPFEMGNDAFPKDKIPADFEKYWDDHNCGDTSENGPIAKWQARASKNLDDNTGLPVADDVEPCLLIKRVVGANGAKYDTEHLTTEEQKVITGSSGGESSSGASAGNVNTPGLESIDDIEIKKVSTGEGSAPGGLYKLPESKYWTFGGATPESQRVGTQCLVQLVAATSKTWKLAHPDDTVIVGDLNANLGHASHKRGVDVDISTLTAANMTTPKYSPERSKEYGKLWFSTKHIEYIFFNDEGVRQEVNSYAQSKKLPGVMQYWNNHEDHFHVRIKVGSSGKCATD